MSIHDAKLLRGNGLRGCRRDLLQGLPQPPTTRPLLPLRSRDHAAIKKRCVATGALATTYCHRSERDNRNARSSSEGNELFYDLIPECATQKTREFNGLTHSNPFNRRDALIRTLMWKARMLDVMSSLMKLVRGRQHYLIDTKASLCHATYSAFASRLIYMVQRALNEIECVRDGLMSC